MIDYRTWQFKRHLESIWMIAFKACKRAQQKTTRKKGASKQKRNVSGNLYSDVLTNQLLQKRLLKEEALVSLKSMLLLWFKHRFSSVFLENLTTPPPPNLGDGPTAQTTPKRWSCVRRRWPRRWRTDSTAAADKTVMGRGGWDDPKGAQKDPPPKGWV